MAMSTTRFFGVSSFKRQSRTALTALQAQRHGYTVQHKVKAKRLQQPRHVDLDAALWQRGTLHGKTLVPIAWFWHAPECLDASSESQCEGPSRQRAIHAGAIAGHVLVKNIKNVLPPRKPLEVAVFIYEANIPRMYGTSGIGTG
jgi:hypothetical protein